MPIIEGIETLVAHSYISKKLHKLAKSEVFGINCNVNFADLLSRYIIADMFDCTEGVNLGKCDKDCLIGKMTNGLNNCC